MYGKQSIFVYNQVSHFLPLSLPIPVFYIDLADSQSQLNTASSDELSGLEDELKTIQKDLEIRRKDLKTVSAGEP